MHNLIWVNYRHRLVAEAASVGKDSVNLNAARRGRIEEQRAMRKFLLNGVFALLLLVLCAHASAQQLSGAAGKADQSSQKAAEASFLSENQTAMRKMMKDMAVKPSGDVDTDFTAMMIPHHQGAVDMAQAELNYGHNKKLRRIASNIISGQRRQIGAMRAALGRPLPGATSSSTAQSDRASGGSATATTGAAQSPSGSMQMEH
jgi:hypothetical protein